MTVYINLAALATTEFRSDSLGALDSVAHPLEPGLYRGNVFRNKSHLGNFEINVLEDGTGEQIEIDVAKIEEGSSSLSFTGGAPKNQQDHKVFAVFYSGNEKSGYYVTLINLKKKDAAYDSRKLSKGDYFIFTPVQPGTYKIGNDSKKSKLCKLIVENAQPSNEPRPSQAGVTLVATSEGMEPKDAKIISGDGVVVQVSQDGILIHAEMEKGKNPAPSKSRRKVDVRYYGTTIRSDDKKSRKKSNG